LSAKIQIIAQEGTFFNEKAPECACWATDYSDGGISFVA
jgi:hypothetical protein